jgi:hypothetical protein
MTVNIPYFKDLRQIIAADQRCSTITPEDDQIWELDSARGEPPGLAFQTTYGLRAYGIRVFPRFSIKKVPVSDPRSFSTKPQFQYVAPNFIELQYSPFSNLDVIQKTWVPDSHTLTTQVALTNGSAGLIQVWMEWIVQLNPLLTGSPMSAAQISVNTVLQGQTGNLFPVFLLTGGPRGDLSAFPSLGIEVTLQPHTSRQFSWALATLASTEDSFYAARKATAYSLDHEQIKIQMLKKGQSVSFSFPDPNLNQILEQSQQRVYQLLLPPYRSLENPWYVTKRDSDHGNLPTENSSGFSAEWGIQKMTDLWALSRMLLPLRPDLVKGMLQNLLNQQGVDGTLYAQFNWNGKVTNLAAAPLAAALAVEIYESTGDKEWLSQNYAALIRATKIWFQPENDRDQDGWPEWQHILQTGLAEDAPPDQKNKLEALIQTAEWPSLAALLLNECRALIKLTNELNDTIDVEWLESQIAQIDKALQVCWDQKHGMYAFRDQIGHFSMQSKALHTFRQNGVAETISTLPHPSRLVVHLKTKYVENRAVNCQVKGVVNHHEKTVSLTAKDFRWEDEDGLAVSDEVFSVVKKITVTGLKKGERLVIETPHHYLPSADLIIPLWAGTASKTQTDALINSGIRYLDAAGSGIPVYLKIMWLEALTNAGRRDLASRYLMQWYLGFAPQTIGEGAQTIFGAYRSKTGGLEQLIPLKTLLQLLGIERISDEELILGSFNEFFPQVNVQYKKFKLDLESGQAKIENLNGESVLITEPGPHRIKLS